MSEKCGSSFEDVQIALIDTAMEIVNDSIKDTNPSMKTESLIKYRTDKFIEVYNSLLDTVLPR